MGMESRVDSNIATMLDRGRAKKGKEQPRHGMRQEPIG
jgi:hypothetical protein